MKSGQEEIPTPTRDPGTEIGHHGNGAIIITYLGSIDYITCKTNNIFRLCFHLLAILIL